MGFTTWNEAVATVRDRADWRGQWLYAPRGEKGQMIMMIRINFAQFLLPHAELFDINCFSFVSAMSELLFECYNVPSVAYGIDSLFSLYHNFPVTGQ